MRFFACGFHVTMALVLSWISVKVFYPNDGDVKRTFVFGIFAYAVCLCLWKVIVRLATPAPPALPKVAPPPEEFARGLGAVDGQGSIDEMIEKWRGVLPPPSKFPLEKKPFFIVDPVSGTGDVMIQASRAIELANVLSIPIPVQQPSQSGSASMTGVHGFTAVQGASGAQRS